jgi:hypothetical protein
LQIYTAELWCTNFFSCFRWYTYIEGMPLKLCFCSRTECFNALFRLFISFGRFYRLIKLVIKYSGLHNKCLGLLVELLSNFNNTKSTTKLYYNNTTTKIGKYQTIQKNFHILQSYRQLQKTPLQTVKSQFKYFLW